MVIVLAVLSPGAMPLKVTTLLDGEVLISICSAVTVSLAQCLAINIAAMATGQSSGYDQADDHLADHLQHRTHGDTALSRDCHGIDPTGRMEATFLFSSPVR